MQLSAVRTPALAVILLILAAPPALPAKDPFGAVDRALRKRESATDSELRDLILKRTQYGFSQDADELLFTAELLEQAGDYRANDYFTAALAADPDDAAYELFFADYLRNFRGPGRPLFAAAEEHYFAALAKLSRQANPVVRERVLRGLVALYQEDGLPLAWRQGPPRHPFAFLAATDRAAKSTSDLDEVRDVRDSTAEALFAESALRLHRALTLDELRGLLRVKEPRAVSERLRFRAADTIFDVAYERREIAKAQVTSFLQPDVFNRVTVNNLGAAFTWVFDAAPDFDGSFRQALRRIERRGLVESLPQATERVLEGETELAFSHLSGSGKTDFVLTYVTQGIHPEIPDPPRRWREIWAVRFDRQILRPFHGLHSPYRDRFATRGIHLFGGFSEDREHYGTVEVRKSDLFVGTSIDGLGPLDVTLQPTVFRERVSGDRSQTSSQLRLDGTLVLRLLDEEAYPGLTPSFLGLHPAFVHLVVPLRHDTSIDGLSAFENERVGVGLDAKFFALSYADAADFESARFGAATVLLSGRYERESFPRLNKRVNLMSWTVSLGF